MPPDTFPPVRVPDAQPPDLLPEVNPNVQPLKPKKNKRKLTKILSLALILLILGGAGVFAWQKIQSGKGSSGQTPAQDNVAGQPNGSLYFKLGEKIVAYNPKTKAKVDLVNNLPFDSSVIGFYSGSAGWRAYYTVQDEGTFRMYYIENDKSAEEIYSSKKFVIAAANAKTKTVAYSEIWGVESESSLEDQTSHHYLVKDGTTTKLQDSAGPGNNALPRSDLANRQYAAADISPDGTKILYDYINRFYSEGGPEGALEYEITTGKTKVVSDSGVLRYTTKGNYLAEKSSMPPLGFSDESLKIVLSSPEKAGGEFEQRLSITNEPTWARVVYQERDAGFFSSEVRGVDYIETGSTAYGGFYRVGFGADGYEKVEVSGLPSATHYVNQIGVLPQDDLESSCFGVVLNTRGFDDNVSYKVGVVCIARDSLLKYEEVEERAIKLNGTYLTTQVL